MYLGNFGENLTLRLAVPRKFEDPLANGTAPHRESINPGGKF